MTPERFQCLTASLNRRQTDLSLLMEDVHKPRNFAAILRSCDAVGVLDAHAVTPGGVGFRRPKAAAGALRWLRIHRHKTFTEASEALRSQGMQLVAAHPDEGSIDFRDYDYTQPTALVMGSELRGLSQEALDSVDTCIRIPMMGMVASLNVATSASLILYEAQRQREQAGMYNHCRLPVDEYQQLLFEYAWPKIARRYRQLGWDYPEVDLETGDVDWSKDSYFQASGKDQT